MYEAGVLPVERQHRTVKEACLPTHCGLHALLTILCKRHPGILMPSSNKGLKHARRPRRATTRQDEPQIEMVLAVPVASHTRPFQPQFNMTEHWCPRILRRDCSHLRLRSNHVGFIDVLQNEDHRSSLGVEPTIDDDLLCRAICRSRSARLNYMLVVVTSVC